MFYERLEKLCSDYKISINGMLLDLEMSPGNATRWKKGTVPDGNTLRRLAMYFHTTTDYLLGLDDLKQELLNILDTPDGLVKRLVTVYNECDEQGKLRIIQVAMNEHDRCRNEVKHEEEIPD